VSQPVGEIKVRRGLETYGGKGESLVKGVVVNLSAIALSVKPGGSIERVQILGGLLTHGPGVEALETKPRRPRKLWRWHLQLSAWSNDGFGSKVALPSASTSRPVYPDSCRFAAPPKLAELGQQPTSRGRD